MAEQIPEAIECAVTLSGQSVSGLLLKAKLKTTERNPYTFIFGPSSPDGVAVLTKDQILTESHAEHALALMDFSPIEAAFSGEVEVWVMDAGQIQRALDAYSLYGAEGAYPQGYENTLRQAMGVLKDIDPHACELSAAVRPKELKTTLKIGVVRHA